MAPKSHKHCKLWAFFFFTGNAVFTLNKKKKILFEYICSFIYFSSLSFLVSKSSRSTISLPKYCLIFMVGFNFNQSEEVPLVQAPSHAIDPQLV